MAHTEETKAKIRAAWVKRRETFVPPMKGKKMSDESRQKMSAAKKGKPNGRLGKTHTAESRQKMSDTLRVRAARGERCHSYKDGAVAERRGVRFSPEYKQWRYDVFVRDEFTCQACGDARGGNLRAHHIMSFALYPSARFDTNNGITLCKDCHDRHHYG